MGALWIPCDTYSASADADLGGIHISLIWIWWILYQPDMVSYQPDMLSRALWGV